MTSGVLLSAWCSFAEQPEELTIAIIRPRNVSAYQEAVDGFLRTLQKNSSASVKTVFYESPEGFYKIRKQTKNLNSDHVDLLLTLGTSATADISNSITDIPVVFSMVLDPESAISSSGNIVGASLNIPPEFQLKMIKEILPAVKKVGIIYDPKKNTRIVKDIVSLSQQFDVGIRSFPVTSPKEIPEALSLVAKETDVLLGLVDSTVYTSQTAKYIISYTITKRPLPFIGISESYVKAGALCSLVLDNHDIGRQSAELASQILAGTPASSLQNTTPEKLDIAINLRTAEIIGVEIPKKIREKAAIIYE